MSRRPANPGADRAAANQQTLKTLVKIESNKSCADCKRNKHPRWASWNLGIFVCIRCSGIHRGMGTHISRVKSVDLDAWTDEQLASMLKWGNARANKYWEAKLAPGHVPAETKIENFIRTKYDSKRWAMEGGVPDPSTLDVDDDDVPLNVVKEKTLERNASLRATSTTSQPPPRTQKPNQDIDLFGDMPSAPIPAPRSNSAAPVVERTPLPQAPPKPKGGDSLLGFDFLGTTQSNPPSRPSSTAPPGAAPGVSRPDLKQSILSLYSSAGKSSAPHSRTTSMATSVQSPPSSSLGGLGDDFSGLSFGAPAPAKTTTVMSPSSAFTNLASPTSPPIRSPPITSPPLNFASHKPTPSGGSFFNSKPAPSNPPPVTSRPPRLDQGSSDFGDFGDFASASPVPSQGPAFKAPTKTVQSGNNGLGDLFDFSAPETKAAPKPASSPGFNSSPFNLSDPKATSAPKPAASASSSTATSSIPLQHPWGGSDNDVWASNETKPAAATPSATPSATLNPPPKSTPTVSTGAASDWGDAWGSSAPAAPISTGGGSKAAPTVTADEEFGGWESSAAPPTPAAPQSNNNGTAAPKPFNGVGEDLFSNVWE